MNDLQLVLWMSFLSLARALASWSSRMTSRFFMFIGVRLDGVVYKCYVVTFFGSLYIVSSFIPNLAMGGVCCLELSEW